MTVILETFPAPALDANRWNEAAQGAGVSAIVGVPIDGYYPQGVDQDLDAIAVDSSSKLIVPGQQDFEYQFFYDDLDLAGTGIALRIFIGWTSVEQTIDEQPKHQVIFELVYDQDTYQFAKRTVDAGSLFEGVIAPDPIAGDGVSGLRMVRQGFLFRLFYYDNISEDWEQIDAFNFNDNGLGFISFGHSAETVTIDTTPWIIGT